METKTLRIQVGKFQELGKGERRYAAKASGYSFTVTDDHAASLKAVEPVERSK